MMKSKWQGKGSALVPRTVKLLHHKKKLADTSNKAQIAPLASTYTGKSSVLCAYSAYQVWSMGVSLSTILAVAGVCAEYIGPGQLDLCSVANIQQEGNSRAEASEKERPRWRLLRALHGSNTPLDWKKMVLKMQGCITC
jgi:hypothetical protein